MEKKDKAKKYYEKYSDDDGRSIINMNVEGMPWYEKEQKKLKQMERNTDSDTQKHEVLSGRDLGKVIGSATLMGLGLVAVFSVFIVLFILFCTNIWFT